ncbi:uncharacterized protein LOC143180187 [Calliopsis andreniformis]|uniref:uncharacterized protein LOC143180187 n=1 Tax=Calliopsis andreniformis TaxID=337506 RepID=UPI003FCE8734
MFKSSSDIYVISSKSTHIGIRRELEKLVSGRALPISATYSIGLYLVTWNPRTCPYIFVDCVKFGQFGQCLFRIRGSSTDFNFTIQFLLIEIYFLLAARKVTRSCLKKEDKGGAWCVRRLRSVSGTLVRDWSMLGVGSCSRPYRSADRRLVLQFLDHEDHLIQCTEKI